MTNRVFLISVDGVAAGFVRHTSLHSRQPRQYVAEDWARDHGIEPRGVNAIDVTDVPAKEIERAFSNV